MASISGILDFIKLVTTPSQVSGTDAIPSIEDIRRRARRKVPRMIFDFVDGGAGDEETLRANERDFARVKLKPKALVDVQKRDTKTVIGGTEVPLPLILGPAGLVRVVGNGGELAAVRAAGEHGVPYTISTSSAWSIEELAAEATGPLWFQLYLWRSKKLIESLVQRARDAGCTVLVLTVDVPLNANRIRDLRNGMSIPPKLTVRNAYEAARRPAWIWDMLDGPAIGFRNFQGIAEGNTALSHSEFINTELSNLGASWEDLAWLRKKWDGPIYVKGVTTVSDAERALQFGADGVIVSNHGGRQLDGLPSSVSALPRIVDAVSERAEIIVDGGVRTGVDIVRALGLGADAVMVARPWVFGVAAAGQAGVSRVLRIFEEELRQTLALLGANSVSEVGSEFVDFPAEWMAPSVNALSGQASQ